MHLRAWRNARFAEEQQYVESGLPFDFTAYTDGDALLEVRQYGAQAGDAVISIGKVTSEAEGVRFLEPGAGILKLRIDQATLAAAWDDLGGGPETGDPIALVYDLRLTGPDDAEELWLQGNFTLYPGVSIDG